MDDEGDFQGDLDEDDSFDSDFESENIQDAEAYLGQDDEIDLEAYLKWR